MPGRIVSPTLIGRAAELEALREALDQAAEGRPTHQLIAGEAGVGKSRLVREASILAIERGFRVLTGACADIGDGGVPYGPVGEILRQLVRELEAAEVERIIGPARADLARIVPSLGPTGAEGANTEFTQPRLLDAMLTTIQRTCDLSPVMLVIEDLHWADPATRDAVAFLVRHIRTERVLLAMTFRSDELQRRHPLLPWLAELGRTGRADRTDLARLDAGETRDLLAAILGQAPTADLVSQIHRRSDGNPFFVEELVGAGSGAEAGPLPPTLRDVLLARLVALPENAQTVIRVAAVAGRGVDHDLLAEVAGMPDRDLDEALRSAIGEQVLVTGAYADSEHGADYAFRHALLQEAAYDDLLPGERQRLHRSFASALASRMPGAGALAAGHWAELAHHWWNARDDRHAFEAFVRAGGEAAKAFAFADGRRYDERALDLWGAVSDAEALAGIDHAALLARAAEGALLSGDSRRAVALGRQVLAALGPNADRVRLGTAIERLARALWIDGDLDASLNEHRRAMETIPVDPATAERARAMSGYAQILMLIDRWEESSVVAAEAAALARAVGAREAEGHALCTLGIDLAALGDGAGATEAIGTALVIAREVANADDIGRAHVNFAASSQMNGDLKGMLEKVYDGAREADGIGLERTYSTFIRANGITAAFELGDWAEAARFANGAVGTLERGRTQRHYSLTRWIPLLAATGDERTDEVLEEIGEALDGRAGVAQYHAPYRTAAAEQALWRGDPAAALAAIERGVHELPNPHWTWYGERLYRTAIRAAADAAEVARARRDRAAEADALATGERYAALLEAMVARALERQGPEAAVSTRAEAATGAAELERLHGRPSAGAWSDAAGHWAAASNPYLTAYCRWRQAEALLADGDRVAATSALVEAQATALHLGAKPLRTAIEGLATRARLDLATNDIAEPAGEAVTSQPDPFGLTRRERDVLPLLVQGRTNRQIAEALFISENTAGVHVSNILGKLGAATRAEAAGIAARLGLGAT
jgi:ATP/maltotriose-dependent transcriptional regulator MalT